MLNNIKKLDEKVFKAIEFETGLDEQEIFEDYATDTADSIDDIKKGFHSFKGKTTEFHGTEYFIGEAQEKAGEPRNTLMVIKHDKTFNIVVFY